MSIERTSPYISMTFRPTFSSGSASRWTSSSPTWDGFAQALVDFAERTSLKTAAHEGFLEVKTDGHGKVFEMFTTKFKSPFDTGFEWEWDGDTIVGMVNHL